MSRRPDAFQPATVNVINQNWPNSAAEERNASISQVSKRRLNHISLGSGCCAKRIESDAFAEQTLNVQRSNPARQPYESHCPLQDVQEQVFEVDPCVVQSRGTLSRISNIPVSCWKMTPSAARSVVQKPGSWKGNRCADHRRESWHRDRPCCEHRHDGP